MVTAAVERPNALTALLPTNNPRSSFHNQGERPSRRKARQNQSHSRLENAAATSKGATPRRAAPHIEASMSVRSKWNRLSRSRRPRMNPRCTPSTMRSAYMASVTLAARETLFWEVLQRVRGHTRPCPARSIVRPCNGDVLGINVVSAMLNSDGGESPLANAT